MTEFRHSSGRRFVCWFAGSTVLLLLVIGAVNIAVDPLACFGDIVDRPPQPNSHLYGTRTAKAELIARDHWDVILAGSSRVELGLDPQSAVWGNLRVFNAGLAATSIEETRRLVDFAVANASAGRIVIGLDFGMFNDRKSAGDDFSDSKLNSDKSRISYCLENLWGSRALNESLAILLDQNRRAPKVRQDGFKVISNGFSASVQRQMIESQLQKFMEWDDLYGDFQYTRRSRTELQQLLQRCRDAEIEVKLVILPVHALQLEAIHHGGLWDTFESWKRDVVDVVEQVYSGNARAPAIVDFTSYDGPNAESIPRDVETDSSMKWYVETSHFRPELGDVVLEQLLSGSEDSKPGLLRGRRLVRETIEGVLNEIRQERKIYLRDHADDARVVTEIVELIERESRRAA